MEGKQFKMKEHPNNQRMEYRLELRKRRIEAIISKSRFKSTSNQNQQFLLLEEEKEELPEVVFRVNASDAQKIKALKELPVDEEPQDKVVVEIEGEPKMEF